MKRVSGKLSAGALLAILAGLQACATPQVREAVPAQLANKAEIADMSRVRLWGDADAATITRLFQAETPLLKAKYEVQARTGRPAVSNILALSGGADDGAFGAGLLVGWGEQGGRPDFDLVTGVSAGSLIAPFAFLGRESDKQLAEIFVKYGSGDIYQSNVLSGLLGGAAVADNAPLAALIASYVDAGFIGRIGVERAKGRFLLIGTTNLDAQRPVFWDMGRIAQVGTPQAHELFRKVLLASAAVPGIFPPVHIDVAAGGHTFQELHVDGGPTREVFLSPDGFRFTAIDRLIGHPVQRRLWVIRNGKITPEYAVVEETALAVAARSLETLTKNQGIGDLWRMHEKARRDGIDYNLAFIPADFKAPRPKPFASSYMQALYARGFAVGRQGGTWIKAPPGVAIAQR